MKKLLILGAGTAGTMMANKLAKDLDSNWSITIVDKSDLHYYQPGFLFVPFGTYQPKDVVKSKKDFINKRVTFIIAEIEKVEADKNIVKLSNQNELSYDYLIIATGTDIYPTETEGLKGELWHKKVFDFYTYEGSVALAECLKTWKGGKLVINITEMPIKCPVAPLEFAFLADSYFKEKGMREKVEISYVTPLSGAFTKPIASKELQNMFADRDIKLIPDFAIGELDNQTQEIVSFDNDRVPFDLLITIPTHKGASYLEDSNLGDELNFVPTHKETLQAVGHKNIFVIGDTTNVPASKAGSVAHFQADVLTENFLDIIEGKEPKAKFDGHANCFIESGNGKGLLIDFNYETEPLPGYFPFAGIGPMRLLKETRMNHWGKLFFRWIYWNVLIKGIAIPFIPVHMSKKGKKFPVVDNAQKQVKSSL